MGSFRGFGTLLLFFFNGKSDERRALQRTIFNSMIVAKYSYIYEDSFFLNPKAITSSIITFELDILRFDLRSITCDLSE